MVWGLESLASSFNTFFDILINFIITPIIVLFFVFLFFAIQYALIKFYFFLFKELMKGYFKFMEWFRGKGYNKFIDKLLD